jgi:hypothetical protein
LTDIAFNNGKLHTLSCNEHLFVADITNDDMAGDPWVSNLKLVVKGDQGLSPALVASPDGGVRIKMLYLVELGVTMLVVQKDAFLQIEQAVRSSTGIHGDSG